MSVSPYTEVVLQNVLSGSKNLPDTVRFARKLSPGHDRIALHRSNPPKRSQRVEKPSRYTQIRATNYDMQRNRLLGSNMSKCTENCTSQVQSDSRGLISWASACCRALKHVLNGSKNPPGTGKIALQTMIYDEIVYWASTCRGAPK